MKYDFGFIGCGNMGGAILGCIADNHPECEILAFDIAENKSGSFAEIYKNVTQGTVDEVLTQCRFVFLGLKPQVLPAFLAENNDKAEKKNCTYISMAAGTAMQKIEGLFTDAAIIRIMPNIPVTVGEGVVLYCVNDKVADSEKEFFAEKMACTGLVAPIEESKIDAASAISGCGPAFAYMFIEALADGGVQCGLTRQQSIEYAAQMLLGSARNVLVSGVHPDELKDRVCSPGGTTIAGVHSLEENAFRYAAAQAVIAAYEKTLKLK